MIYLDNGATSYPKPRIMLAAMEECILRYCGNPGRSGHQMSMRTGEEVYHARRKLAERFEALLSDCADLGLSLYQIEDLVLCTVLDSAVDKQHQHGTHHAGSDK